MSHKIIRGAKCPHCGSPEVSLSAPHSGLGRMCLDCGHLWTPDFNVAAAAAVLGRLGGQSRSPKKRKASARNGKRGGRPRKLVSGRDEP